MTCTACRSGYAYGAAGTYTVTLTAVSSDGGTAALSQPVTVQ